MNALRQPYYPMRHEEIPYEDRFGLDYASSVDSDWDRDVQSEIVSTYRSKKNEGAE